MTRNLRRLLFRKNYKEVLIFLSFLFVSAAFWLFLALGEENQMDIDVPLRLEGVPENVVITSDLPKTIRVTVKDRSIELLSYLYFFGSEPCHVDINWREYESQGQRVRVFMSDVQRKLAMQLNQTTKIIQIKPDSLEYCYNYGLSKQLPVSLDGEVLTGPQHYVVRTVFYPDTVTAYAPDGMLSSLKNALTKKIHRTGVNDTIMFTTELCAPKGAKYVPNKVTVKCFVDMFTEKTVDVPVVGEGFPPGTILRTFPSKVAVTFQIGVSLYNKVEANDFKVVVRYNDVKDADASVKCIPHIVKMPAEVRFPKISPDKIDYLIESRL